MSTTAVTTTEAPSTTNAPASTTTQAQTTILASTTTANTVSTTTITTTTTTEPPIVKQCQEANSVFDITSTLSEFIGESVSCRGMTVCPDGSPPPCSWTRKIATQCFNTQTNSGGSQELQIQNTAIFRIRTNSLPNHCYQSSQNQVKENNIDFQVIYKNKPRYSLGRERLLIDEDETSSVTSMFKGDNQLSVNFALCSGSWTSVGSILQVSPSYQEFSGIMENIVGIALNGVPIHIGNSEYGSDVFHPKKFGDKAYSEKTVELDQCLGSSEISGFYHYYGWSPCILPSDLIKSRNAEFCRNIPACIQDQLGYSLSFLSPQEKTIMIIGIARDGHSILGPYKRDGELWQPCDVDMCNGIEIAGIYYYVTTMFHPYTVGCWGPAPMKKVAEECSNNVKICSNSNLINAISISANLILIFILAISS
ncbi:UNKNOWN [Stylonychia lemnae]|uniref:YHYH domain-containing protein n=1 Tax=Stylonychia lemnae TaxID=5949 RepID=A0A078BCM2_STYLE|nr:UNKNOWN [Stylonychia lemnae]|eukprot:CDW90957.1 UNKNOWN [Stylonychia lemnae]